MSLRLSISPEDNLKNVKIIVVPSNISTEDLLKICSNKFNTKFISLYIKDSEELTNDSTVILSKNPAKATTIKIKSKSATLNIISKKTDISQDAITQLKNLTLLPGMIHVIGMPDLHAGGSCPIGAVSITEKLFYPHLIGSDIGCGMSFIRTNVNFKNITFKKLLRRSKTISIDHHITDKELEYYLKCDLFFPDKIEPITEESLHNNLLGTIGSGNHFLEMQIVEKILDTDLSEKYKLNAESVYLLVHSGSRKIGESILEKYKGAGISDDSEKATEYFKEHNSACHWAKRNRYLIAQRFLQEFTKTSDKQEFTCLFDSFHNNLTKYENLYIHRKGASSSLIGPVIIPGSRGTHSYVVLPINGTQNTGFSVAHGSGRKLSRTKAHELKKKYTNHQSLRKTDLDSVVICSDTTLLYEESPDAYKDIDTVIADLTEQNLIIVIAIMRPVLTYKINVP